MASMTDVIFLLLIFFMVTSTFVFPTGLEVNLPQGAEQSAVKPVTRVYIDANDSIFASTGDDKPQPMTLSSVALYADETVRYGRIVEVLSVGAEHNLKMVLATKPVASPTPSRGEKAAGDDSRKSSTSTD